MLNQLNRFLERAMPLITPTSIILGIILADQLRPYTYIVPWIFFFMSFSGSLGSGFKELFQVFLQPLPLLLIMAVLHIVMPLIAWGVGSIFFRSDPYTVSGLILAMAIPAGISSLIWVSLYRGHIALTLSVILIDTLLSPLVVPGSLYALVGAKVSMDAWGLMKGLLWMVVVPSLLGMSLHHVTRGKVKQQWGPKLAPFAKLSIIVVVAVNGAVVAPYLSHPDGKLLEVATIILLIASLGYALGWLIAKLIRSDKDVTVSLVFNSGMRNTVAGSVLALTYFPPPVAIPVTLCIIFQQTLAGTYGFFLNKTTKRIPESSSARS